MISTRTRRTGTFALCALAGVIAAVLSGCMVPIPTVQPLTKINLVDETRTVARRGAERVAVHLRLLSKELTVRGANDIELLRGRFSYNVQEWVPKIRERVDDTTLNVTVDQGLGNQIPIGKQDEYLNAWAIELAAGVPLDLDIDMGAGVADLDLTGLAVEKLAVTSGSTDLLLVFSAPNPRPLGDLTLTAGTGKMVATGLGYANFDTLSVFGGAGTVDLDFSGAFSRSAVANVRAGAGKIAIRVPGQVGVRVTFKDLLPIGAVETVGFTESGDGVYVNGAYGQASETLTVKVTSGIGSISLISE